MSTPLGPSLVFVYNADAGVASAVGDWLHKIVSPSTYECSLCGVSYGHLGMKREWRAFIGSLGMPVRFAYRDTWVAEAGDAGDVPALWMVHPDGRRELRMGRAEFDACATVSALADAVRRALEHKGATRRHGETEAAQR